MKVFFTILISILCGFAHLSTLTAQGIELPVKTSLFLKKHFPDYRVVKYKYDVKDKQFKVSLESGHELKFGSDGQWIDIKGEYTPLPKSIIDDLPSGIINYISKNYSRKTILRIKLKDYGYKIELARSKELKFNTRGDIIGD